MVQRQQFFNKNIHLLGSIIHSFIVPPPSSVTISIHFLLARGHPQHELTNFWTNSFTAKARYYAGLSDCPHSKHRFLYFDVINPQDGHILKDPKSPTRGRSFSQRFSNLWASEVSKMRARVRSRRSPRFIRYSFPIL